MTFIIQTLYSFLVFLGDLFIFVARFFDPKIKLLFDGRKKTWKILESFGNKKEDVIWIHCASLGEFEQGRPVIERIKATYPNTTILLSFFSPSGYEIRKNYSYVDEIIYLPSDLKSNNERLIKLVKPKMLIFVKYEFWWNLIETAANNNVKLYLISGVFRNDDYFFKPMFSTYRSLLRRYDQLFIQDEISGKVLTTNNIDNFKCVGDTRIDGVIERSLDAELPKKVDEYCQNNKVIIYGSIWMSDLPVIKTLIQKREDLIHILAPHDISTKNITDIREYIVIPSVLYSDNEWNSNICIIDNIGLLNSLYKVANYAFIGGGFEKGIHNILEPAVFRIPVFFGPNYKKFNEATDLTERDLCFPIQSENELLSKIEDLENNKAKYLSISAGLDAFFTQNKGATEKIMTSISRHLE